MHNIETSDAIETVALKKTNVVKMEFPEMKIPAACVMSPEMDVSGTNTRGTSNLTPKLQDGKPRWFAHVLRRDEDYVERKVVKIYVQRSRKRGRPIKRRKELVEEHMRLKEFTVFADQDKVK